MVVIVRQFPLAVELLASLRHLPSVGALRPACCPACDHPAFAPGKPLRIVGHGKYRRQVLGLVEASGELLIWVRRYLCRGCGRTISVLPAGLYPRRLYAGMVIVASVFLSLLCGQPAQQVCRRWGGEAAPSWKTLGRWERQMLWPLFGWLARQLGIAAGPARDRSERRRRLGRMLALHGLGPPSELEAVQAAACALVSDTAHDGARGQLLARAR
jgi:hypothetical protein